MLFAGYDETSEGKGEPSLYFMDYLSSCVKLPFAIHGYGSAFGLSICDKYYKPNMNEQEALVLLNKIVAEIQKRFLINLPTFHVRVVSKSGIRELPTIYAKPAPSPATDNRQTESMDI